MGTGEVGWSFGSELAVSLDVNHDGVRNRDPREAADFLDSPHDAATENVGINLRPLVIRKANAHPTTPRGLRHLPLRRRFHDTRADRLKLLLARVAGRVGSAGRHGGRPLRVLVRAAPGPARGA